MTEGFGSRAGMNLPGSGSRAGTGSLESGSRARTGLLGSGGRAETGIFYKSLSPDVLPRFLSPCCGPVAIRTFAHWWAPTVTRTTRTSGTASFQAWGSTGSQKLFGSDAGILSDGLQSKGLVKTTTTNYYFIVLAFKVPSA